MTRIIGNRGLDVSEGGRSASRSRSCSSSYVNRSGSEEGLYGLKSRRIGLEWVSSRIISNVSVGQRRALRLIEHGNTGEYMEMFEVKEGRSQRSKRRRHTITSTSIISHYLIFKERSQSLLNPLQDLGILEVRIVVVISDTSSFSSATLSTIRGSPKTEELTEQDVVPYKTPKFPRRIDPITLVFPQYQFQLHLRLPWNVITSLIYPLGSNCVCQEVRRFQEEVDIFRGCAM